MFELSEFSFSCATITSRPRAILVPDGDASDGDTVVIFTATTNGVRPFESKFISPAARASPTKGYFVGYDVGPSCVWPGYGNTPEVAVRHGDPPAKGGSPPRNWEGASGKDMSANTMSGISNIYKLIERSHDGGQIVGWHQKPDGEAIVRGKPIVSTLNKCVVGIPVTDPETGADKQHICALQCAGVCTVAATFFDVERGVAPYAWLHQPVWYDINKKNIIVRATGSRSERWSTPGESAYLLGWTLGCDVVAWGVALRLQLATAAPPLI